MRQSYKYKADILAPIVEDSLSVSEVLRKLGLRFSGGSHAHIKRLIAKYELDTSHFLGQNTNSGSRHRGGPKKKQPDEVLILRDEADLPEKTFRLRRALLESGREHRCEMCGQQPVWNGKPLTLQIDHINGKRNDNRSDNLRFSCPNCHSQTETFGALNITPDKGSRT